MGNGQGADIFLGESYLLTLRTKNESGQRVGDSEVDALVRRTYDVAMRRGQIGKKQRSVSTPSAEEALDPNLVKVVRDDEGNALYFSRARIPYDRDNTGAAQYYGHMGMYAYRREALDVFRQNAPGHLETTEKLEQLRLLQKGATLAIVEVESPAPGVDTTEDLQRVRLLLSDADKGRQKGHEIGESLETPFTGWVVAGGSSDIKDARAFYEKLKDIELVLTDVDGVLTDGGLYYGADGEALKRFCSKDGLGISLLRQNGIRLAVVSGRDCPALRKRLDDLGISFFRLGESHKKAACEEILREANVLPGHALFVGDDLPDIEGFKVSGFGVAVGNAHEKAKDAADMVLQKHGGHGAFRELCDHLLAARENDGIRSGGSANQPQF